MHASAIVRAQATQMPPASIYLRPFLAALLLANPQLNGAGQDGWRGLFYGEERRMKVGGSGRPTWRELPAG